MRLSHLLFAVLLALTLATPSWRVGPFTWWPVWRFPMLAGRPADVGLLSLLPGLIILTWTVARLLQRPVRRWRWGKPGITLPFLGLTLLGLASLEPTPTWRTATQIIGFGLFWLVYLFVINENPCLTLPLAFVIVLQAGIAIGQFLIQSELGLGALGELRLDPGVSGTSVLWARDQRWLRAYGLTAHPNFLGATLTICLLSLWPFLNTTTARRRAGLAIISGVGLLGLLTSFSRASWLGLVAGLLVWIKDPITRSRMRKVLLLLLVVAPIFLFLYRDLVLSRFLNLSTVLEARSLNERWRDIDIALDLIIAHPWRGVGSGNLLTAARLLHPFAATVHNVPLLVGAELGLPGIALWFGLVVTGLRAHRSALAPWVAMLVIGLFDNTVWLTTSWRAAILVALLAAQVGRDKRPTQLATPRSPNNAVTHPQTSAPHKEHTSLPDES